MVFNWYMRDEFRQGNEETRCPICNRDMEGDSEKHIYLYCEELYVENIRLEALDDIRKLVYTEQHDSAPLLLQALAKL